MLRTFSYLLFTQQQEKATSSILPWRKRWPRRDFWTLVEVMHLISVRSRSFLIPADGGKYLKPECILLHHGRKIGCWRAPFFLYFGDNLSFKLNFFWRIAVLQCYVNFCCTNKVNQPYIYIHPLSFGFPSHLALNGVPCAIQSVLISDLFYTQWCVYVNFNFPIHLSLPLSPRRPHISYVRLCLFLLCK